MKMKTQIKRKAKRMLALLLTAMLIISTMVVSLSVVNAAGSDGYQTACMHLIGDFTDKNWDSNQTEYDIDTAYNTGVSDGLFYYEATVTPNTTYYFALYSNDNRYAPATQHTVIANSKESAMSGDYGHTGYSWKYTSGANTTKVRICVDQYSPSEKWYPLVWIEDESVEPTTSAPTGEYYLWTSVGQNDLTNTSLWTKYPLSATSDGMYNAPRVAIPTENKDLYLTVTKTSDNPYNTMVWENQEAKNNSKNNSSYVGGIDQQQYYVSDTSKEYYFLRIYFKSRNGSLSVDYDTTTKGLIFKDAGSTPVDNVTINVPTVDNATVTAAANSTTYNEGDSFEIEVGSSFTVNVAGENGYTLNKITYGTQSKTETGANFRAESGATTFSVAMDQPVPDTVTINVPTVANATVKVTAGGQEYTSGTFDIQVGSSFTVNVTPATGYKFGNISYNNESYNNGDAITAVKDVTNIAVTVAVDTVNVGFTKLNNATINVSYINDQATSATAEITADTTLAMQKGTEFTVTVTPITDYELKSIAYGTATSSKNPATFTASADGAVTVTVEQTTPVVETVTVTVPFVENASVAVEYTNDKGAVTTTTITDANADIVMEKDTNFTVTLNVNSGYKCDTITMTYASLSKSDNPATFTASTNGKLAITADISQTLTGEATIKFKSARSYMYKVSMSVNGAAATEMTRPDKASTSNDDNFGTSYTGTLTFCWYTQKITVTNGDTTTLSFKTSGTKLNAKVSAKLEAGKTYYFAVDDIAPSSNTEVTAVELPSGNTLSDQMKRNYFHSARHLIYNGTTEDSVLGFTNIDNQKFMIGQLLNNSNSPDALSVVSATAVQKSVSSVEEYSDLQNTLLDANMNGKLDVKDATLIQKAVVGLV